MDVVAVREACFDFLRRHIDVDNCVEMYGFAVDHYHDMLKDNSMLGILKNFSAIYKQASDAFTVPQWLFYYHYSSPHPHHSWGNSQSVTVIKYKV